MAAVASKITSNPMFIFVIVGFVLAVIMGMDAMASFADSIYAALTVSFEFLPVIAIVGSLAYIGGTRR